MLVATTAAAAALHAWALIKVLAVHLHAMQTQIQATLLSDTCGACQSALRHSVYDSLVLHVTCELEYPDSILTFKPAMLQAFTRCAQQEPDNGEAWNNIAAIHLQLQHAPEAFSALSEAVKYKRESWQTWSNYGQAAAQTGNHLPAARAVQKASFCPLLRWGSACCKELSRKARLCPSVG